MEEAPSEGGKLIVAYFGFYPAESDDDPCDVEEELLQAARTGNAAKIVKLIQQNTGLNVNCKGE